MSQDSHESTAVRAFSPWKWIAWTAAILIGLWIATTAVHRHRMEKIRTEVESRGGRLEGNDFYPDWYDWLLTKAPNGWPKEAVLKLKGNFQRVVSVRLPPGVTPPHDLISRLAIFPRLEELVLRDCHLTDADLEGLSKLTALKLLALDGNPVSDRGLADLDKLVVLEYVYLHGTRAGDEVLRDASRIPKLDYLDLTNTDATDAGLSDLGSCPKLSTLMLDNTRVSDSGIASLAPQPSLLCFSLGGCSITDRGLGTIDDDHFPTLGVLNLEKTQVTADGVARLRLNRLGALIISNLPLADEHWRELARMKALFFVQWGEKLLGRESGRSSTGRSFVLDSFIQADGMGLFGPTISPSRPIRERYPQSPAPESLE